MKHHAATLLIRSDDERPLKQATNDADEVRQRIYDNEDHQLERAKYQLMGAGIVKSQTPAITGR